MVFYTLGTGYYLSPGGGGGFLLRQRSTYVIPRYSVVLIPPIESGISYDPPSSIPVATKSRCCYMQASDIYINTYVS